MASFREVRGPGRRQFTVISEVGVSCYQRTYHDTAAGRLEAARDKVSDLTFLRGHEMRHWSKGTRRERPDPYFTAVCAKCGAGVKVTAGRTMNWPGYPGLLRFRQVQVCPGKSRRRPSGYRRAGGW